MTTAETRERDSTIYVIRRPEPVLRTYYFLRALMTGPAFPFMAVYLWFRYHTMQYAFTEEGISMRWGILFRRETIINYARIQDIHLRSNVAERWLGLARVLVQTASGNSGAEMTLEGLKNFEDLRDFLYARMRGVTDEAGPVAAAATERPPELSPAGNSAELTLVLQEIAAELRALRTERGGPSQSQIQEGAGDV